MKNKLINLILFSLAMGLLEAAVVIYLRALYYPEGFHFPVNSMSQTLLLTELWREFATLLMLACIGYMNGETKSEKFAAFLFSFGIWDISYYLFLKIFLNWPATVFDWDLLFLLPVPWIGPVITPIIISATLMAIYVIILLKKQMGISIVLNRKFYLLLTTGFLFILYTYMHDSVQTLMILNDTPQFDLLASIRSFLPKEYNWTVFCLGELFCLLGIGTLFQKQK